VLEISKKLHRKRKKSRPLAKKGHKRSWDVSIDSKHRGSGGGGGEGEPELVSKDAGRPIVPQEGASSRVRIIFGLNSS